MKYIRLLTLLLVAMMSMGLVSYEESDCIPNCPVDEIAPNSLGVDLPPVARIDTPATDQSIAEGQVVSFTGTCIDTTGTLTHSWVFPNGTPGTSTDADPGNVTFSTASNNTATYTCNDGTADSNTDSVVIDVAVNAAPNSIISAPIAQPTTLVEGNWGWFNGDYTDDGIPSGGTITYSWTFQDGTPSTSTDKRPGQVYFNDRTNSPLTVTLTVNDGALDDPTPASMQVNVVPPGPTVGVSVTANAPGTDPATITLDGTVTCVTDSPPCTYSWTYIDSPLGTADDCTFADPGTVDGTATSCGEGTHTFSLEACNETGCSEDDDFATVAAATTNCVTSDNIFQSIPIGVDYDVPIEVLFDFIPNAAAPDLDAVTALSTMPATSYDDHSVLVRANTSGNFDVRDGGVYRSDATVPYVNGTTYAFDLDIDIPGQTYTVTVTPAGGSPTVIATDYQFRQPHVSLGYYGVIADPGTHDTCDFSVSASPSGFIVVTADPPAYEPASITLDGETSLYCFGSCTYDWDYLSGLGCTITDDSLATAEATGCTEGTHLFQLTVTNPEGSLIDTDTAIVIEFPPVPTGFIDVSDENPEADPTTLILDGSQVSCVAIASCTYSWSKLVEPGGTCAIQDSTAKSTTATNCTTGAYTFQLQASNENHSVNFQDSISVPSVGVALGDLNVPASRIPDWAGLTDGIGVVGGMPNTTGWAICDDIDTVSDSSADLQAAVTACGVAGGGVVRINAGTINFPDTGGNAGCTTCRLTMPSNVVVRGAGMDSTIIKGEFGARPENIFGLIQFVGSTTGSEPVTDGSLPKGTTELTVASSAGFSVGDWIALESQDISDFAGSANDISYPISSGNAVPAQQDVFAHNAKIVSITGNGPYTITIDRGLFMDFSLGAAAGSLHIYKINHVENSGLESLRVESDVPTEYKKRAGLIVIEFAKDIWLNDVHVRWAVRQNVMIYNSTHITIANSKITAPLWTSCDEDIAATWDIFKNGGDGWPDSSDCANNRQYSAYSIELGFGAQQVLISNNLFDDHYVLSRLSHGSHQSVWSHNYTVNSRTDQDTHGLFFHGGGGGLWLVESNDIDSSIDVGDVRWGKQGWYNTFYRNRLRSNTSSLKRGMFEENASANTKISHVYANIIANHSWAYFNSVTCNYQTGNCGGGNIDGIEEDAYGTWLELNVARDVSTPSDAYGFLVLPESTTDCGDGTGQSGCAVSGSFYGLNYEGNAAPTSPTSPNWDAITIPDSLYFASEADWEAQTGATWCTQACAFGQAGIGAFGDDFDTTLCKLPAEIVLVDDTTCTP